MSGRGPVLIIEGDAQLSRTLSLVFKGRGYDVRECCDDSEAEALCSELQPVFIMIDAADLEYKIMELLRSCKEKSPQTCVVVQCDLPDGPLIDQISAHVDLMLVKPFALQPLLEILDAA